MNLCLTRTLSRQPATGFSRAMQPILLVTCSLNMHLPLVWTLNNYLKISFLSLDFLKFLCKKAKLESIAKHFRYLTNLKYIMIITFLMKFLIDNKIFLIKIFFKTEHDKYHSLNFGIKIFSQNERIFFIIIGFKQFSDRSYN